MINSQVSNNKTKYLTLNSNLSYEIWNTKYHKHIILIQISIIIINL